MAGHHGPPGPAHQPNGHLPPGMAPPQQKTVAQALASANEAAWIQLGTRPRVRQEHQRINLNILGSLSELQGDLEGAIAAYEHAIQHNSWSIPAMSAIAAILRNRDQYGHSIEYLRNILKLDGANGDVWGQLGTLFSRASAFGRPLTPPLRPLLPDDGQSPRSILRLSASTLSFDRSKGMSTSLAHFLRNIVANRHQEPKLWYGIGILYDRYGSLEHAEEAFSQVMRMSPDFDKANEVYFRLGIIYKQQSKYNESLNASDATDDL